MKEWLVLLMWYIAGMLLCDALLCDMTHYQYNVIIDNTSCQDDKGYYNYAQWLF